MLEMAKKGLAIAAVLAAAAISSSALAAHAQGTSSRQFTAPSSPGYAAELSGLYGECRQQVLSEWPPNSGGGFSSTDRIKDSIFAACLANGGTLPR